MRELRGKIDVGVPFFNGIQIFRKGLPVEGNARGHDHLGDVFDTLHEFDRHIPLMIAHRRETDSAVSHDHGRDTVVRRRHQPIFPGDLTIVLGVDIDEAGRHQMSGGVDLLATAAGELADCGDAAVFDRDIGVKWICAAAVENSAIPDDEGIFSQHHCISDYGACSATIELLVRCCAPLGHRSSCSAEVSSKV